MAKRKCIHIKGMEHGAPIPNGVVMGNMVFSSAIGGKDAKTGVLSDDPQEQAEAMFRQLRLNPTQRSSAIQHFRDGAEPGFDPTATVSAFAARVGQRHQVQQTLFAFLASMALADGELAQPERVALHHIASLLGLPTQAVDRVVAMLVAQSRFHTGGAGRQNMGTPAPRDRLNDA